MFEQAFKNIDDVLWKEAGCTTELDYTEQTSWLLFLKYLDGLEQDRADEAALEGRKYAYILDKHYRWDTWAAPKTKDGKLDHNAALTGDDLRDFVNQKLFPYLHAFKQKATGPNTIEYKVGEIFGEIKNKITSGYNLREIIDHIDALRFRSQTEKHELSHLYEAKIKNMGNAGRNGGEYYTPRPLIRAIVEVVAPKIGETIYDGALGSAGFHCEAFDYLKRTNPNRTTDQDRILQERTFYGKEKKSLAYLTGPSDFGPLNPIITKWTEHPKIKAKRGDVLITVKGSGVGKINLVDEEEVAISRQLMAVRVTGAAPSFVHAILTSTFDHFQSLSTGAAIPGISREQVLGLKIALPTFAEQQRIVGILDEAFAGIATARANAEKNRQNARALFESHLQSVFTQRGKGWVDRQLASLCHEITVGHVGSMKTEYKECGIPFLRSQNIRPFEVSMENAMFIDETFHRALKKSQLRPGDLAIVRTGYPGTAAVIPPELPDSNCSDLVIVHPSNEVNPHFLAAFFNSAFGKQLVLSKIVGAAQKHFNITAAKEVMLHVPPIPEQRTIIAMVDDLRAETQRLVRLYERKLAALEALKKSLLHQAFSGEL